MNGMLVVYFAGPFHIDFVLEAVEPTKSHAITSHDVIVPEPSSEPRPLDLLPENPSEDQHWDALVQDAERLAEDCKILEVSMASVDEALSLGWVRDVVVIHASLVKEEQERISGLVQEANQRSQTDIRVMVLDPDSPERVGELHDMFQELNQARQGAA